MADSQPGTWSERGAGVVDGAAQLGKQVIGPPDDGCSWQMQQLRRDRLLVGLRVSVASCGSGLQLTSDPADATVMRRVGSHRDAVLYQDARWQRIGRLQYGFFAYPLWILGVVGSVSTGVAWHVGLALALLTPPIAICEWRMRRMGFRVTEELIELIRPLNRTQIRWEEIDQFDLVAPAGLVDYGHRRVMIKRHRHGLIPRARMQLPTLWITAPTWWPPFRSPTALRASTGQRIPDVMRFLNDQLAAHTNPKVPA